jgi:predicted MFS family arabinose efflux permease
VTSATTSLLTRPLLVRFVSIAGAATSFYLLLSCVPQYARSAGASASVAGLATSALTLASVAAYLVAPRLMARYGYRLVLAGGLLALGLPALALAASANIAVIMTGCVIRGIGFALTCVAGSTITVALLPPGRRGEGLALVGFVSGVPAVATLPLGVWLAAHVGFRPVLVAGGVAALAGLASVPWLPRSGTVLSGRPAAGPADCPAGGPADQAADRPLGIVAIVRDPALLRTAVMFAATTMAVGIIVTFLPMAVPRSAADMAAAALLIEPAAAIGGRWLAGRHGDRHGAARLLVPGMLLAAAGTLTLALAAAPAIVPAAVPVAALAGAALFGAGFGMTQNASQTLMYDGVPEPGYGAVSAVWNLAYDGGMGLGAAGFGVLAAGTGYPGAFALAAVLPPLALAAAGRSAGKARTIGEARSKARSG